jgi:hypothetical protein
MLARALGQGPKELTSYPRSAFGYTQPSQPVKVSFPLLDHWEVIAHWPRRHGDADADLAEHRGGSATDGLVVDIT